MKTAELLKKVNNNGREAKLICASTKLPTVRLCEKSNDGVLMVIDLSVFVREVFSLSDEEVFVIGRDEKSDYKLPNDERFSRFHCFVARVGGMYQVFDSSLCGTALENK